jgi:hypothetical protein
MQTIITPLSLSLLTLAPLSPTPPPTHLSYRRTPITMQLNEDPYLYRTPDGHFHAVFHGTLHTVHCTLYTVRYTLYTVHCTLYTHTLYTVH